MIEELLTFESKTLRPKMEFAVELFPLPVFPSKTSRISEEEEEEEEEEEDAFLPEQKKRENGD